MKAGDSRYEEAVMDFVQRANGVLLSGFLIVRSFRRGLTNEDTILKVQQRLRMLPTDLAEYCRPMLDAVEEVLHKQAARLYLLRIAAPRVLTTITLSYFDEESPDLAPRASMSTW